MSTRFRQSDSILDRILAQKSNEIEAAKARRSLVDVQRDADRARPPRDFARALRGTESIRLIAEVKKASPSKGVIRADFDPLAIAREYESSGAHCLSVLTDENFFQGHLDYLRLIASSVEIPVMRKEFILDPYQVYEARAAGADAVLLIAECLHDETLVSLRELIEDLGMSALVELYDPENISRVLEAGATLIGVNNRDLRTFETDLEHTIRMRKLLPNELTLVGESGISSRADAALLQANGVDAMLVGESLMRQPDVGAAVRQLLGLEPES